MPRAAFQKYNPHKQYGAIILPAGENVVIGKEKSEIESNSNYYPRSKKAAQVMQTGNVEKGILVTGGYGGLEHTPLGISGGKRSFNYLLQREDISDEFVFFDDRSRETLGNFALPVESPMMTGRENGELVANPSLDDLESILLITEEGHMGRALECAAKVLPYWQMDYLAVEGPCKPGLLTAPYHVALMLATRGITKLNSGQVVEFLDNDHPFYKHGDEKWFKKSLLMRRIELAATCSGWILGTNEEVRIKIT